MHHLADASSRLAGLLALTLLCAAASGCATTRKSGLGKGDEELTTPTVEGDLPETIERAESHWKNRLQREQLDRAIELYEKAVKMDGSTLSESERKSQIAHGWERLARGYFFLADKHLSFADLAEEKRKHRQKELYAKGISAAENAIVLRDPDLSKAISGGKALREVVGQASTAAIPGLYWYAINMGRWGTMEGLATIMQHKDDIQASMQFICDNEPSYYFGGCHRYFGAYWTKLPFGKDPQKSLRHFDRSIEIAPKYLANKVVKARYYATLAGKRKLYERLLREVLEAPADALAEAQPENAFAQKQARRLLEQTDRRFD